jgi:signal transduction histidine kinase
MKLLNKTSIYYILFSIIVFVIGGFIFYHIIKTIVNRQINDSLTTEREIIQEQIDHSQSIPDFTTVFGHQIEVILYSQRDENRLHETETLTDTLIFDSSKNHLMPFRHLLYLDNADNGRLYQISIYKPTIDSQDLIEDIFFAMLLMFFSLLILLIPVNYFVSKKIWIPFYDSIRKISNYEVHSNKPLSLPATNVLEFDKLNNVLTSLTEKINRDFLNLKEFTEDMSHETQTPLAIIRSKLELLIQTEQMDQEKMQLVQAAYEAVTRLSRLNQSLSLISKIENQQFEKSPFAGLNSLTRNYIANHQEIIQKKELTVIINSDQQVVINMNPDLADILVSNLIGNAIRHNLKGGIIEISIDPSGFVIKNTGPVPACDPRLFFGRFRKDGKSGDSLGLGLSIVKKICDLNELKIDYSFKDDFHTLTIDFQAAVLKYVNPA